MAQGASCFSYLLLSNITSQKLSGFLFLSLVFYWTQLGLLMRSQALGVLKWG